MNRSGIVYPDLNKKDTLSDFNLAGNSGGGLVGDIESGNIIQDPSVGLVSSAKVDTEGEKARKFQEETSTQELKQESGENTDFEVRTFSHQASEKIGKAELLKKMQKSPHRTSSDNSRRFASYNNFGNSERNNAPSDNKYSDLLTIRQIDSSNQTDRLEVKESRKFSKDTQKAKSQSNKNSNSSSSGRKRKISLKRRSETKEDYNERGDRSESALLNLMFVFEIFRWFTSTDVVVRFIVGAIAGVVGFGFMFTQMGLLNNF